MGRPRKTPAEKLNTLPQRYHPSRRIASWNLDWRSPIGIKVMAELLTLAQDLGGWENLSRQKQILVERVTHMALKCVEWETADYEGKPLPFDHGAYHNKVNALKGYLNDLGLERQARSAGRLDTSRYIARSSSTSSEASA